MFFYYNILIIQVLAFLVNLLSNKCLKIFLKILIQYILNKIILYVKFSQDRFEMFWLKNLILYFFMLVSRVLLTLDLDASHKQDRFSKTLSKKSFVFGLSRRDNIIAFNLSFVLLL